MPALDVRAVSMVTVLPTLGRCVFFFPFPPHLVLCALKAAASDGDRTP